MSLFWRCDVCRVEGGSGPDGIMYFPCPECPKVHRVCKRCLLAFDLVPGIYGPGTVLRECASDARVAAVLMGRTA